MKADRADIEYLVGEVAERRLLHHDCFFCRDAAILVPATGVPPDYQAASHSHPSYSFVLSFDDSGVFKVRANVLVTDPGKVVAISPGVVHEKYPSEIPPRFVALFLSRDFFEAEWKLYAGDEHPQFDGDSFPVTGELTHVVRDFMQEFENRMRNHELVLQSIAHRLTHVLIRLSLGMSSVSIELDHRNAIDRVILFIHSHYGEKVLVEQLAAVASLSPTLFTRVFQAQTGRTPLGYLLEVRLEKSRKLLEAGGMTVADIAQHCGFQSSSHFASSFRMKYRLTPAAYKKPS